MVGTNLSFGFSYHPKIDGQIEVINRSIGNLLRCLTKKYGQASDQLIGQDKYAYNKTINRYTSKVPFEVIYGLHPRGICELRELESRSQGNGYAKDFSHSMKEVHEIVRKTQLDNTAKLKKKVNAPNREFQF